MFNYDTANKTMTILALISSAYILSI